MFSIDPVLPDYRRDRIVTAVNFICAPLRAVTYLVGAVLGALAAGFVTGWRDAA
jgi:hypothetical protein